MIFKKKQEASFSVLSSHRTLHRNLAFAGSEQYKLLRANLTFTLPEGTECPVIGVTSSIRGEGKSTTSINLAHALAEDGKKVALMDGDLRIPSVGKKMEIPDEYGVTDLLVSTNKIDYSRFKSDIHDNWYIFPAGKLPPNPSELIGSEKMARLLDTLRQEFDFIIIDLPPVNVVSDAVVISRLITGLILVIRADYTSKKDVEGCVRQIRLSNAKLLGCVFNDTKVGSGRYGRYKYGKYGKYRKYYKYYKSEYRSQRKD